MNRRDAATGPVTPEAAGSAPRALRVAALADADSFVKWAAALIGSVPDVSRHLAVVQTPLTVSEDQQRKALIGSGVTADEVSRIPFEAVRPWAERIRPDVVVVSARGPLVRLLQRELDHLTPRPVIVVGLPGISIPAQRGAATYRRHADLFVVHSRREKRAFHELYDRLGLSMELGLATLPFAHREAPHPVDLAHARQPRGTDFVFAAQALIPRERAERERVAGILRDAALADPTRRVVVKLRASRSAGEEETHLERDSYEDLLRDRPDNLVFSHAPMCDALAHAEGLVTVSSTAAIEAMALGVPVIALDTFGVKKTNLNTVFAGSGVLGDAADVVARRFRHPSPTWREQNYFHREIDSTWWAQAQRLVARRRRGDLAARPVPMPRGGVLHLAWQRKSVLGDHDRTISGAVALAIGIPLAKAIVASRRLRGRRGRHTWLDDASDITLTPARHQDPMRRAARTA